MTPCMASSSMTIMALRIRPKNALELPYQGVSEIQEMRKRHAGFDAESTEDPKSKRVRTCAGQENLTGELMDSMARPLLAMST